MRTIEFESQGLVFEGSRNHIIHKVVPIFYVYAASIQAAPPCPPPMHREIKARFALRRLSS